MTQNIRVGVSAAIVQDGAVLLVAFDDAGGYHYNLPGGGIEPGEGVVAALVREVREETGVTVAVGRLLCAWEYVPTAAPYGPQAKLNLLFACTITVGTPALPAVPDPHQVGVVWLPLADLPTAPLLPPPTGVLLRALQTSSAAEPGFFSV
ncbi:MAG: NUDIX domain-containing protein [Chloroflexota bacterium]|nr:NUDIX domain-containing protein [Chloroflexota bacterium]